MPLRWKLPSEEETDELYRRIDQLMTDLYHLIRAIIFGPPPQQLQQESPGGNEEENNVPDLLAHLGPSVSENNSKGEEDTGRPPTK